MNPQLDLPTAIAQGKAQGDACLEKTRQTESTWPERAWGALVAYANLHRGGASWTGEDATAFVCRQPGVGIPDNTTRATGALFSKLKRKGIACQTDEFYRRANGHGTYARRWKTI